MWKITLLLSAVLLTITIVFVMFIPMDKYDPDQHNCFKKMCYYDNGDYTEYKRLRIENETLCKEKILNATLIKERCAWWVDKDD